MLAGEGLTGEDKIIDLSVKSNDIPNSVKKVFPHLQGCTALQLEGGVDLKVTPTQRLL